MIFASYLLGGPCFAYNRLRNFRIVAKPGDGGAPRTSTNGSNGCQTKGYRSAGHSVPGEVVFLTFSV